MIKYGYNSGWLKSEGDAIKNFTCTCDKCGSNDVSVLNRLCMGSEWTGQYGSIDLICNKCNNEEELYS